MRIITTLSMAAVGLLASANIALAESPQVVDLQNPPTGPFHAVAGGLLIGLAVYAYRQRQAAQQRLAKPVMRVVGAEDFPTLETAVPSEVRHSEAA